MFNPEKIRNVAIIAHIDHGKTTLLDSLLKQSNIFRDNEVVQERMMDSYDQEKERGITIFAKETSLFFEDFKINLIDTPGHADFAGEVERVLGMVNSVLLIVDAFEGPMPQTRFVLSLALKLGLNPIVILNKIDRPHADPDRALNLTFDLFVELGATDEQLDFPIVYCSAINNYAMKEIEDERKNMRPLFEVIIDKVQPPSGSLDRPFLMQATTLSYNDFIGRMACGRILEGVIKKGDTVVKVNQDGHPTNHKVTRIEGYHGLKKVELEEAGVGDIVSIAGIPEVTIGDTLCSSQHIVQLPSIDITEPTLSMDISVNSGPFAGKEGKHVTMNKIRDRLERERKANISLRIEEVEGSDDMLRICGRGELHISVLIEAMRREGFEMSIAKPQVITKKIDGEKCEPVEIAHIEVPAEFAGAVIEELSRRKGEMTSLDTNEHNITTLTFTIPTRGLMGYRNDFLTLTKGKGILTSRFENYAKWKGEIPGRQKGVLISICAGKTAAFALFGLQDRGTMFVVPTQEVYEGMIVGQNNRENDLVVNVVKGKQLTNVRSSGKDEAIALIPPRLFSLEQAIDFVEDDELIEITPASVRLRKRELKETDRKRKKRSS